MKSDGDGPPKQVKAPLGCFLPTYAEARDKWPLWTGDVSAWERASEVWVNRIHWSVQRLLLEVTRRLRDNLEPDRRLFAFLPHEPRYQVVALSGTPAERLPRSLTVPSILRLQVLAVSATFSSPVPCSVGEIVVPDLSAGGLSEADLNKLSVGLQQALAAVRTGNTRSLAGRFALYNLDRAAGEASSEGETELAVELARLLGLTLPYTRTTKNTISAETLRILRIEARGIVAAIREWYADVDQLVVLGQIISDDKQLTFRSGNDPGTWLDLLRSERASLKEKGERLARRSWVAKEAQALSFPFLTPAELSYQSEHMDDSEAQAADRLLLSRLPATIGRDTLASLISRSRT